MMNAIEGERACPSVSNLLFHVEDQRDLPTVPEGLKPGMFFERLFPTIDNSAGMLDHSYEPRESLVWAPERVANQIHVDEAYRTIGDLADFVLILEYL